MMSCLTAYNSKIMKNKKIHFFGVLGVIQQNNKLQTKTVVNRPNTNRYYIIIDTVVE